MFDKKSLLSWYYDHCTITNHRDWYGKYWSGRKLSELSMLEEDILASFLVGMTIRETAEEIGISYQNVGDKLNKLVRRATKYYKIVCTS